MIGFLVKIGETATCINVCEIRGGEISPLETEKQILGSNIKSKHLRTG
jgi:hypothetical protein